MEDITAGERVREYRLEARTSDDAWKVLAEGTSVGHKRIQKIEPAKITQLRLHITKSVATPRIRDLAIYNTSGV